MCRNVQAASTMIYALEGGIVLTRCQNNLSPACIRGAGNKSARIYMYLCVCVLAGVCVFVEVACRSRVKRRLCAMTSPQRVMIKNRHRRVDWAAQSHQSALRLIYVFVRIIFASRPALLMAISNLANEAFQ